MHIESTISGDAGFFDWIGTLCWWFDFDLITNSAWCMPKVHISSSSINNWFVLKKSLTQLVRLVETFYCCAENFSLKSINFFITGLAIDWNFFRCAKTSTDDRLLWNRLHKCDSTSKNCNHNLESKWFVVFDSLSAVPLSSPTSLRTR